MVINSVVIYFNKFYELIEGCNFDLVQVRLVTSYDVYYIIQTVDV